MVKKDAERRRTLNLREIVRQGNKKKKADNPAVCVVLCSA